MDAMLCCSSLSTSFMHSGNGALSSILILLYSFVSITHGASANYPPAGPKVVFVVGGVEVFKIADDDVFTGEL